MESKLAVLEQEAAKARKGCQDTELSLTTEKELREKEGGGENDRTKEEEERDMLMKQMRDVDVEIRGLQREEEELINGLSLGAGGVLAKKDEVLAWKQEASLWTDNIYTLEQYIKKLAGGDGEIMAAIQRECYGDSYVEGEGLREI